MSNLIKCAQNFGITIAQPKKIEIQNNKKHFYLEALKKCYFKEC